MTRKGYLAKLPPYAAIKRLADHVFQDKAVSDDYRMREERAGPIAVRDHILQDAWEVLRWLDANLMTDEIQDMLDEIEGRPVYRQTRG
jgi:hypothetical protein